MHVTPPTAADVEASAKASPIVATLAKLRDFLGPTGREMTEAGGVVFDDSHMVAELFGLPVIADPDDPGEGSEPLSPDPQPRVTLAFAVAFECGAIDEVGNRLVPSETWDDEDIIVKAATALSALIDLGPMWTSFPRTEPFLDVRDAVLDGSFVNWLATLLPADRRQRVDHFVNWGVDVCREQFGTDPCQRDGELEMWVANGTCYLVDTLVWAGAIDWFDQQLCGSHLQPDARWFGGGSIRLTALGRHVLPDHLAGAGVKLREPDGDAGPTAAGLLGDVLVTGSNEERRALVAAWRRDLDDAERARLVAEVLLQADHAPFRLVGFDVLEAIGPEVAAPYVRQLLDSPSAEGAAQFLVTHGLADRDHVKPFLGYGPLIDALASTVNQPDRLRSSMIWLLEQIEDPELLLEVIALYPTAEATMLLTAAARHVTDPRFADLIRAAEALHRECLAERDPAL